MANSFNVKVGAKVDTKQMDAQLDGYHKTIVVQTKMSDGGYKEITTFKNGIDSTAKAIEKFDSSGKSMGATIKTISTDTSVASTAIGRLGQDFLDTTGKVLKFGASTAAIALFSEGISQAVSTVKEFDDALTEFKKVSDLSGSELTSYTDKLGELGKSVARTKTEMISASTEFKKSGYTDEESAELAKVSALYQNIADEQLSAADASSVIISQMRAFNLTADDSIKVVDALNEVSNTYAVSSGDLGKGLTAAGAALATYGNSFDQVVGLVTAGTEIFQGKSAQVARGLNTIASRISKNEEALAQYRISIKDSNGDLKSTYDILAELAPQWNNLTKTQQVALGNTLAGTNQYKIFAAVMANFDNAVKATETSINSAGSAEKENAKYMESLQAKLQALKTEFQDFVLGDGGINDLLKGLVDAGTAILKFANSDLGQLIIRIGLVGTAFGVVSKLFGGKIIEIGNTIKNLFSAISKYLEFSSILYGGEKVNSMMRSLSAAYVQLTGSTISLAEATATLSGVSAVLSTVLAAIPIIAIVGAIVGAVAYTQMQRKEVEELTSSISKLSKEVDILKSSENLSQSEKDRLAYLEKRIELTQKLKDAQIDLSTSQPAETFTPQVTGSGEIEKDQDKIKEIDDEGNVIRDTTKSSKSTNSESNLPKKDEIQDSIDSYKKLVDQIKNYNSATVGGIKNLDDLESKRQEELSTLTSQRNGLIAIKNSGQDLTDVQKEQLSSLNSLINKTEESKTATSTYSDVIENYGENSEEAKQKIKDMADEVGMSADDFTDQANAMGMTLDEFQAYMESTNSIISMFDSDFSTAMENAMKNAEQFGDVSSQAFQKGVSTLPTFKQEIIDNFAAIEQYYKEMNENNGKVSEATAEAFATAYEKNPERFKQMLADFQSEGESALPKWQKKYTDALSEITTTITTGNDTTDDSFESLDKEGQNTENTLTRSFDTSKLSMDNLGNSIDKVTGKLKTMISVLNSSKNTIITTPSMTPIADSVTGKKSSGGEIDKDGAYLVGESPTEELVVGRDKADKGFSTGEVVTLHKGDQVINHNDTEKILGRRANGTKSSSGTRQYSGAFVNVVDSQTSSIVKDVQDAKNKITKSASDTQKSVSKSAKKAESDTKKSAEESAKATEDAAKKAKEAWKDAYDKEKDALDHSLAMDEINETEYYKKLGDLNEKYFGESTQYHEDYLKEYRQNEEEIYKWEKQQKKEQLEQQKENYETAIGFIRDELESMKSDLQDEEDEELNNIQDRIDAINDEKDAYDDAQQVKIDALNKEKDAFDETTNAEISALEDKKEAESDEWQAKLDALNNTNDALEKQKKLQEYFESLAKAKATKVKIFKDGKFVYSTDMSAVDEAQSALDEYNEELKQEQQQKILEDAKNAAEKNYTDQIDNLKTYLNDVDKNYDNQVKILESATDAKDKQYQKQLDDLDDYKNSVQDDYEEQIDDMSSYIDSFDDLVNEYQNQQAKMIADMLAGTDTENSQWLLRLDNLKEFVSGYNDTLAQLDTTKSSELTMPNGESLLDLTNAVNVTGTSSTSSSSSPSSVKVIGPAADIGRTNSTKAKSSSLTGSSGGIGPAYTKDFIASHSSGISSVNGNEMALVGDSPHSELVIGSKLNGVPMRLSSGSGVVNAESTSTLAGLFNTLGSVISSGGNLSSSNSSNSNSITIGNITLPQVKNGEDFVNYLKNINMTQFAYSH